MLYIKGAHTWSASGTAIPVPAQVPKVEVGASVAMVIDLLHDSFFRPPVRFKWLDGFLAVGPYCAPGWSTCDGRADIVTPYFGASGTGQLNAVFPVTPQSGLSVPAAQASSAAGFQATRRL